MPQVPVIALNNGVLMPQLGFGVSQIAPDTVVDRVLAAFDAGYRLIDTAATYGNEQGVGAAVSQSGLARDEVFISTKLWNAEHGYANTVAAFNRSMDLLGLDVLDLYLIHWPLPKQDLYVESWRAFETLYAEGRIRAIGVSNFTPQQLQRLGTESTVVPAVNQIELHPRFAQVEARRFNAEQHIATEAWAPLGQGSGLMDDPTIGAVARRYGKTPAQVTVRWHLQLGNIVIPKSRQTERIRSNIDVFGFELAPADMALISGLDTGVRVGPDPDDFEYVG